MIKKSFTVSFKQPRNGNPEVIILGVTSIVPNLNGFLFFTENGNNYQVEGFELVKCDDDEMICGMSIEYSSEKSITSYLTQAKENPEFVTVIDGRE